MDTKNTEEIIKNISRIILKNKNKMIREEDLKVLCENYDFNDIIGNVYSNLLKVGFELISSNFLDRKYYVLTSEGKDDKITSSQYGILALILALNKEVDENVSLNDLKEIFSEVWESDIEFFIDMDYLRIISVENIEIIKVTPLGKAVLKNIIQDLNLKNILDIFENNKL